MRFDFDKLGGFEWDLGNIKHIRKHDVDSAECEEVFFNRPVLIYQDSGHSSLLETRFQVLGKTNEGRKLFLAFTIRSNKIRIISARDQNRKERRDYEKKA